jgi:hypothetical protein
MTSVYPGSGGSAFQVYNIASNQLTGSAPVGTVGLDWQFGDFATSSPTGSTGSLDGSTSQLVQAIYADRLAFLSLRAYVFRRFPLLSPFDVRDRPFR